MEEGELKAEAEEEADAGVELVLLLLIGWNSAQPLCLIPINRAGVEHKCTRQAGLCGDTHWHLTNSVLGLEPLTAPLRQQQIDLAGDLQTDLFVDFRLLSLNCWEIISTFLEQHDQAWAM